MASLKLLVVEDDIPCLELMTEVFMSLHAEVRPVSDSEQAATLVNQERFDGIFLDLEMPRLHGFDLARLIRKSSWNKTTPIIIVTGRDDRQTMQEAFSLGASFFLQKPVDRQKLSSLFRTVRGGLLENRRRHVRVPLQTDVTCDIGSRKIHGVTWNLSQGGIQVEAGSLHPGDTVGLSFRLPVSEVVIDVVGTVVWASEKRQGIQFTEVSPKTQQSIREFVAAVEE
jgi:DNA-binding response OmpR family regulator